MHPNQHVATSVDEPSGEILEPSTRRSDVERFDPDNAGVELILSGAIRTGQLNCDAQTEGLPTLRSCAGADTKGVPALPALVLCDYDRVSTLTIQAPLPLKSAEH